MSPITKVVLVLAVLFAGSANAEDFALHKSVTEVVLHVGVLDRDTHDIPLLTAADLSVFENRRRITPFSSFVREDNLPLRIGVLIDVSGSTSPAWRAEIASASILLSSVMKPGDTGFVATFTTQVTLLQDWTDNAAELGAALHRVAGDPTGMTAVYDSIGWAQQKFAESRTSGVTRSVLILVTDGDDNRSHATLASTVQQLERDDMVLFAVGINSPRQCGLLGDPRVCKDGLERRQLRLLSDATGGTAYFLDRRGEFPIIGREIGLQLRSFYRLSYVPRNVSDTRYRKLAVSVRGSHRYLVRTRHGFSTAGF